MTALFDFISILYVLRALAVLVTLIRNWRPFWDADVTRADRALANQAAFFLLIPLGVFLHEAGHALATWSVGGTVVDFQWRVFWGYILPAGNFTPLQDWWISLSGNLVSIALGLLPLPLLLVVRRGIWAEILESFARQQLLYALLWYPAFTFFGFGDWVTIYNFRIVPWAELMLVFHVALLAGLFFLDRSRWAVEHRLGRNPALTAQHRQLAEAVERQPLAAAPLARLALFYAELGEAGQASRYVRRAERLDPNDSTLKLAQARLAAQQRNPVAADKAAQAALAAPDLTPQARASLTSQLAFNHMQAGRREEAISAFTEALRLTPDAHQLYHWRGIVRRSLGRNAEALSDFQAAARLAADPADKARAEQEAETTRKRL
ncbi:MAG: tetratricopeptide repeat protein [Anaerolineales bacterium]|nr:tetratricopeptide repeat protein [Anaerolineales bacterium]